MDFFIFASAIVNLSCVMHNGFRSYHDFKPFYCDLISVRNVLPLLYVDNGVLCVPAMVTSYPYGQCQQWGFPRPKVRRKRKRGGRRRIRTVITSDRPQHDQASRRQVCQKNLTNIKIDNTKTELMNFAFMNIQTVNKKENLIENLIFDKKFDFLMLNETRLRPTGDEVRIKSLTPPNYTTVSAARQTGPGGGISFTFKDIFKPYLKSTHILDFNSFECLKIDLNLYNVHTTMFCIYRPPPSARNMLTCTQFVCEFEHFLDSYTVTLNNFFIVGDFNLHFDEQHETYTKQVLEILQIRNLNQLTPTPTHIAGHIIDWLITKDCNPVFDISVSDPCISDHFLVSFEFNFIKPPRKTREIKCRNIKAIDNEKFSKDLISCNKKIVSCDITRRASVYFDELSSVLDRHAPLRARNVTDRPSAPWMTSEIKSVKSEKRRAERRLRKSGLPEHKSVFKSILSKLNVLIYKSKKKFYESKICASSTSRQLFTFVSEMYGKGNVTILPNNISLNEMSEKFNTFFISKISKIRAALDTCTSTILGISNSQANPSHYLGQQFANFRSLTRNEVKSIVLSSSPKSCSLDPIPTQLLFQNIDCIIDAITTIVNDSLISGVMPICFKKAIISPLIKKQNLDINELKNYRPVSNLPFVSKIIEKAVSIQMNEHLTSLSLFESNQSAYRKFHNTETALVKIVNDLLLSADDKKVSVIALLDLSAAFDTIDHEILIQRLKDDFGFNGNVLSWFASYLNERTQCVKINNVFSTDVTLPYGVPQGSVLGPLLYTLYTAPLGKLIKNYDLNYHFYADDTQLYLSIEPSNVHDLIFTLEQCIEDVKNWMHVNKLKLNDDKTEAILINPKKYEIDNDHLSIGEEKVKFANYAKNLGVYIDENLSMNCHITNISKAVYLEIRKLKHMSKFVNESSLKTLATSFVLSRLDYCNALFKNMNNYQFDKLQRLQNFAAKVVLGKSIYDHVTPCLIELHWLPVKFRVDYKIAVLTFKCLNGLAPQYLSDLIQLYVPSRSLRSASQNLLKTKVTKFKTLGDRSFSFTAPSIWNSLPFDLRCEKSIDSFKKKLKTHYFKEAYY